MERARFQANRLVTGKLAHQCFLCAGGLKPVVRDSFLYLHQTTFLRLCAKPRLARARERSTEASKFSSFGKSFKKRAAASPLSITVAVRSSDLSLFARVRTSTSPGRYFEGQNK